MGTFMLFTSNFKLRYIITLLAGVLILAATVPASAQLQGMPTGPIKIIVPFGPGSGTDIIARLVADELQKELGTAFVIENKEGASGIVGVTAAARAAPDGRTLLMTSTTTITSNPFMFKSLPYDAQKDFRPVANVVETSMVLMVKAGSPIQSVDQLIKSIQADPNSAYGFGSGGGQVAGASFAKRTKLTAIAVPYKSSPQAITDLIGGRFAFMFLDSGSAVPQILSGNLRALAIARETRSPSMPNTPTFRELGMNFNSVGWIGLLAPAGVSNAQVNVLNAAVNKLLQKPAVRERLGNTGDILSMTPGEFGTYLDRQRIEWGEAIRDANIEKQ